MSISVFSKTSVCSSLILGMVCLFFACGENASTNGGLPKLDVEEKDSVGTQKIETNNTPFANNEVVSTPAISILNLKNAVEYLKEHEKKLKEEIEAQKGSKKHWCLSQTTELITELTNFLNFERTWSSINSQHKHEPDPLNRLYSCGIDSSEVLIDCTKVFIDEGISYPHDFLNSNHTTPLARATASGHFPVVQFLVEKGVNVNNGGKVIQKKGEEEVEISQPSPLSIACKHGYEDIAMYLMEKGASKKTSKNEDFLLHYACEGGSLNLVSYFIQKGYDLNQPNEDKRTPLGIACASGNVDVVKCLLDNGASVSAESKGNTPLVIACMQGNVEIAGILLERGAKTTSSSQNILPLTEAVKSGNLDLVGLLVEAGCDVNSRDKTEITPLVVALARGLTEIANKLEQVGAKAPPQYLLKSQLLPYLIDSIKQSASLDRPKNPITYEGIQILMHRGWLSISPQEATDILSVAIYLGDSRIVDFLIQQGADVNGQSTVYTSSILARAISEHCFAGRLNDVIPALLNHNASVKSEEIQNLIAHIANTNVYSPQEAIEQLKVYFSRGIDINTNPNQEQGCLISAFTSYKTDVIKFLLAQGARVDSHTPQSNSAIHAYAYEAQPCSTQEAEEVLDLLVEKGLGINDKGFRGRTPLQAACVVGNKVTAEALIKKGADLNASSDESPCPIILCAQHDSYCVAELLLESGCDINQVDSNGRTALMHAVARRNINLVQLLLKYSPDVLKFDNKNATALLTAVHADDYEITHLIASKINRNESEISKKCVNAAILKAFKEKRVPACIALGKLYALKHEHPMVQEMKLYALWRACHLHNFDMVKSAIEQGYPVNCEQDYAIPLEAAICTGDLEIVKLLLKNGADVNKGNGIMKSTPLSVSISSGSYEIFKLLIEAGAKPTVKAAAVAVSDAPNDKNWLELLDKAGCDFFQKTNVEGEDYSYFMGETLLGKACRAGASEAVSFLVSKGLDVNERQLDGKTPLMIAAENGHCGLVKYLIERGADPRIQNDGFSAEDIARLNGNKDIVELLKEAS